LQNSRFGDGLLLNGLMYGLLAIIALIAFPRKNTVELALIAIGISVLIHLPTVVSTILLNVPGGDLKALDILITHFVFIVAGISVGAKFEKNASHFFGLLLAVCLLNLAIELYPDFIIDDRRSIGFLGGQGFSRMLVFSVLGLIIFNFDASRITGKVIVVTLLSAAVFLSFYTGSRGAVISLTAALLIRRYSQYTLRILLVILIAWIILTLSQDWIKSLYLVDIRPLIMESNLPQGIRRTLITLDIFFLSDVGSSSVLSALERFDLWGEAVRMIVDYPYGVGFNGFAYHYIYQNALFPHNVALEILAESGILIGSIYILLIGTIIKMASPKLFPILILLVVFLQFSGNFIDLRQLLFFVGIVLAQRYSSEEVT
jgi:O-antigen ligase